MSKKFDKCVKSVRKTVKARKGSTKEAAAIAICTTSVLHPRGRTLKSYRKGKLMTQKKKMRRGGNGLFSKLKEKASELKAKVTAAKDKVLNEIRSDDDAGELMDEVVETL